LPASAAGDEVMIDPLHPMHQDLLARITAPPMRDERLPVPRRMAIGFYAAVAAWGVVWLIYRAAAAIL
jgi:hypothetical protein